MKSAALLAAAALLAGAGTAAASAAPEHAVSMTLGEREVAQHFIDTGKHGVSAGDRNVVRSQVLNDAGKVIGRFDVDCVVTGTGKQLGGLCHGVITLPDGQLVGEFAFDRSGSARYQAIVGGTRAYAGMRGQATVETGGNDPVEKFTIELDR